MAAQPTTQRLSQSRNDMPSPPLVLPAEYNSGRNMEEWYREVGLSSDAGRALLLESKHLGLVGSAHSDAPQLSQALPTSHAAREYAKAEPEVKEIIKERCLQAPGRRL
jgi:hypothetical protein